MALFQELLLGCGLDIRNTVVVNSTSEFNIGTLLLSVATLILGGRHLLRPYLCIYCYI